MTYLFDDAIRYDDSPNITAFGRLRTANTRILGDYRFMYGSGTTFELDYVTSNGANITINYTSVCAVLSVTSSSGSSAFMQSKQYHPYIPGTGHLSFITFVMAPATTGVVQSVGTFDADNGVFFRLNGTVPEMVIRNRGVDTEVVPQNLWNGDRFDGSMNEFNPSGLTLDLTKPQIFMNDFQWLGVGRVRCGFNIGGIVRRAHVFNHANVLGDGPYMSQPSLPLRWEIKNTTAQSTAHAMTSVCAAVHAEGSDIETGFIRAVSTDGTSVAITAANSVYGKGILAVRLKNTVLGFKNMHALARLKGYGIQVDQDTQFKVVVLSGAATITAANWQSVPGLGWCDYTTDFTLNSSWATQAMILDDQFATGSANNKPGSPISESADNRNNVIFQNHSSTDSQIFAIIGYRMGADILARASLKWLEVK